MAFVMPGLRPQTVSFTLRPAVPSRLPPASALRQTKSESYFNHERNASRSSISTISESRKMPNNNLTSIDIEHMLQQKVAGKYQDLQQAFQNYDADQNLSVTRGEFRRVIELYCMPLTTEQFSSVAAKVDTNPNGTIRYCDFLDKFYPGNKQLVRKDSWTSGTHRYIAQQNAKENLNIDMIEGILKEKVTKNMKNIVKALRLFDYNRDGQVQQHELRKVLENYCFKFTDSQFSKLWQRYDFHHTGLVNYREFLRKIGVNIDGNKFQNSTTEGTKAVLTWDKNECKENGLRVIKPIVKGDGSDMGLHFDRTEAEFRKQMRHNYLNLLKAFLAFDRTRSGFVSLIDLKSILSNFTISMSDQLFFALMERCGVKATGRIPWEAFLDKFQDSQASGNGQTLPIRTDNHKYFPVRGSGQTKSTVDVVSLLQDKVLHHYPSFKQAFLQFDKNRDGKISRKELREIFNSFKFTISNDQFKDLMIVLDPQHTNFIDYHSFLDLFEPKESLGAHKWLNSVHRYNDKQKPIVMAWDTVEDILREKITLKWNEISEELINVDDKEENTIFPSELKDILDTHCLPMTDEHFDQLQNRPKTAFNFHPADGKFVRFNDERCHSSASFYHHNHSLMKQCDEREDSKVNYLDFLINLGVDIQPNDKAGLSTQVYDGSEAAEKRRLADLHARKGFSNTSVQQRTVGMCVDEVIAKLKDRMSQHKTSIRQSFVLYDKNLRGRISKTDFRKVCNNYGFTFTDEQFKVVIEQIGFHNGYMTYMDFIDSFEDPRPNGGGDYKVRKDNHHVNPIRGDEWGMTAEEALFKLENKLRENFADLRGAFYKFDDNHTGYLTKEGFRRLCDTFMFVIRDREFDRLCEFLEIGKRSKISYSDFLDKFEIRDSAEGHHWISDHRFNKTVPVKPMTAEEIHSILGEKVHRQWSDLAKAFCSMDKDGNAVITKRELREVLYRFILPIEDSEYKKLWAMLDLKGCGYIAHRTFIEKLGGEVFAPSDKSGTSRKIVEQSYQTIVNHNEQQLERQKTITYNTAQQSTFLTVDEILSKLKARICDQYSDTYTTFRKYDTKKKGYLTINEIQKVLNELNFFLSDKQFFELLERIGLHDKRSRLNYEQFLKAFEEGQRSSFVVPQPRYEEVPYNPKLTPFQAETALRDKIVNDYEILHKAFSAFDKSDCKKISAADFRSVLDNFAFRLSDLQFKHIVSKLKVSGDNMLDYPLFLEAFCEAAEDIEAEQWLENLQKTVRAHTPHPLPIDDVMEMIKEAVQARFYHVVKAFNEADYAKIGVVSKNDFKDIMFQHVMRLTDNQIDKVWNNLPVNEFGNLEYKDFLVLLTGKDGSMQRVIKADKPTNTPTGTRPSSARFNRRTNQGKIDLEFRNSCAGPSAPTRSQTFTGTPLVNAESVEMKVKDTICKHWRDIQKHCRAKDSSDSGQVDFMDFRDIICRYVYLSDEDFAKLAVKYDVKNNGYFPYLDFLRHFVLTLKHRQPALTERKQVHDARAQMQAGTKSKSFYDAMLRCQSCVSENWKKMRRQFRSTDIRGSGFVGSNDFRTVLKSFSVNLSEEEFFHIISYYDNDLSGRISYNDFIKAFLTNP